MKKTETAPTPEATNLPPARRPGRPRNPTAPRNDQQHALAATLLSAEQRLDKAGAVFALDKSVAAELELYLARVGVSSAWAGYLRAQGDHSGALKYGEEEARFATRAANVREYLALDLLDKKTKPKAAKPEQALGKRAAKDSI